MADDWPIVPIASAPVGLIDGDRGKNYPKTADFSEAGHCLFLNTGNVTANGFDFSRCQFITEEKDTSLRKGKLIRGDVVLTTRGTVGNVAYYDRTIPYDHVRINSGMVIFRPDASHIEPRFLYLFLRSSAFNNQVSALLTGSAQPQLPIRDINLINLPLPDIKKQQAIACILGALDDKIELNHRMNRTLEAIARAIFKSWFVDFDPVRAKVAGGQLPGLAPHIADLFPATFEDSELGEIPKGWKLKTVAEIALINTRTLGKNDAIEVVDYIEISKVMRGQVSEITRYERGAEPSRARRRLGHGDTALSTVRPDRGAYFLCLNPPDTLIASTGFAVASPKNGSWAFLHVALTRPDVGQELGRLADGGAYPAVRPEVIGGLPVVTPSNDQLINAYENVAQPLFKKADRNRAENTSLSAIRDNLLPKLISGELRVPDAESVVERCV